MEPSITNSDFIIIATEWDKFKTLDWQQVKKLMRGCKIVDGRNCIEQNEIAKKWFRIYWDWPTIKILVAGTVGFVNSVTNFFKPT
ncbi:Protein of unknown function [Bacillus mycoides]|nr:Protein of unknown function [Bacillus mycoides]